MPPTTNHDGQAGSFLGLQSYTEAQSNSFFGRDAEINTLTSLIELNTLTIVFGRSGTGKTSLLNAGVFPNLRKSFCLPFRIRLEFNDNSPDLISQIKKVLREEIDKYGFKVESYPGQESLWEYFHKEPLWKTVTPILVFDQFEEIFTLSKSNPGFTTQELPAFWKELSDVIENTIPGKLKEQFLEEKETVGYNYKKQKAKVVFAFREEYLPEFESITAKIPSIKYSRFRLLPMNGNQAYEVITKTWKENISAKEARQLVSYFTNETGTEDQSLVTVEPSLLSQVCAYIDKERIENGGGKVSAELLNRYPKDTILRSIYDETISAADNSITTISNRKKEAGNRIREFIEEKLITTQGYRTKYHLTVHEENLKPGIYVLTARYLIREDDNVVELTHDVLAPIIKSDREKRRKALAAQKTLRRSVLLIGLPILLLALGFWAYAEMQKRKAQNALKRYETALQDKKDSLREEFLKEYKGSNSDAKEIKRLNGEIKRLNGIIAGLSNNKPGPGPEPQPDSLKDDYIEMLKGQITVLRQDSTNREKTLKLREKQLSSTQIENDLLNKKLEDNSRMITNLEAERKRLRDSVNRLMDQIVKLKNAAVRDGERIRILEDSVAKQREKIIRLGKTIEELMNRNPGSVFPGNLRVQVYDKSGAEKKPIIQDTFSVYIIPYSGTNKTLLNNNKTLLYQKDCSGFEQLIPKLNGWQRAYVKDGYYYFHDVIKNGNYKVKICNILDGYFNLQMPSQSGSVFWKLTEKEKIEIKLGRF